MKSPEVVAKERVGLARYCVCGHLDYDHYVGALGCEKCGCARFNLKSEPVGQDEPEKCGEFVASLIAGASWFPCARPKHHDGGHRAAGTCVLHGAYLGMEGQPPQCPKWPECVKYPNTTNAQPTSRPVEREEGQPTERPVHKTVPLLVWADIDEGIADMVRYLNTIPGLRTEASCQGTLGEGGPHPYRAQVMTVWKDPDIFERLKEEFDYSETEPGQNIQNGWCYLHPREGWIVGGRGGSFTG